MKAEHAGAEAAGKVKKHPQDRSCTFGSKWGPNSSRATQSLARLRGQVTMSGIINTDGVPDPAAPEPETAHQSGPPTFLRPKFDNVPAELKSRKNWILW